MEEVFGEVRAIAVSHSGRYVGGLGDVDSPKPNAHGRIWVIDTETRKKVFNRYLSRYESDRFWGIHWNRKSQLFEGKSESEQSKKPVLLWDGGRRSRIR